jgi:hypothetical protein
MSERSIYLRSEAEKCRWHAENIRDTETQAALRKLADEYVAEAAAIEGEENEPAGAMPSQWLNLEK